MDLTEIIIGLREECVRLELVIARLEFLAGLSAGVLAKRSTRGRKSMGEAERREVSERMKRYWAERRKRRALRFRFVGDNLDRKHEERWSDLDFTVCNYPQRDCTV
jgi:hypothetical protein